MTSTAPVTTHAAESAAPARLDAGGTAWRLRSLVAMGHDCTRLARALNASPETIRRIVSGRSQTVSPQMRTRACGLWEAWWDKTPPRQSAAEQRAAAVALRQAERNNWPAAAGLDEDLLDEPGYRPWSHYRPATGTGPAADPAELPPSRRHGATREYPATETEQAMTDHAARADNARRPGPSWRIQTALRAISDQAHAAADARARARGWTVTATTGRLGLEARTYRDPRFDRLSARRPATAALPAKTQP
jgi:hypothetical protein